MSTLQINQKYQHFKIAAAGSVAVLAFGSFAFLQPFSLQDNSYAEEVNKSSSAEMSVTVEPVIEIWTTDTNDETISAANIELDPDESLTTATVRTHVSTSNTTGYTLTIQSESTDAKMVHENESITKTIDPITGEGTSTTNWTKNKDLNNMWGYSIGSNDSYLGVPGSSSNTSTINETSGPSNDSSTDVTFAAKADTTLPAGTYKDTVIFSAVANPQTNTLKQAAEAAGITTMQGMEGSTVCSEADVWQEGDEDLILTDTRDNISYAVRKLKDGHCWMAQNFRMTKDTLSAAGHSATLTSADTNLTNSYTMPNNASWQNTTATAEGAADATLLPKGSETGSKASGEEAIAHGAYYSWATAVANKNSIGKNSKQTSSICPKGWKLPDSDGSSSTSTNQWQALYNAYGSAASFNQAFNTYYSNGNTYYLAGFLYSGSDQYVDRVGSGGYWWSSTSSPYDNYAWFLFAGTSSIYPTRNYDRHYGYSVRCMF